jgi:hypothetical protein
LDSDSLKPVDSTWFDKPTNWNEFANGHYVSNSGKNYSEEEVRRHLKETKVQYYNFELSLVNNQLIIDNKKEKLHFVIPGVYDYHLREYYPLRVVTLDKKEGFLDLKTGKWFLKPVYDGISLVVGGAQQYYFVIDKKIDAKKWFIVNDAGESITKAIFDYPFSFETSQYWNYATTNGMIGTVNRKFEWITEPNYEKKIGVGEHIQLVGKNESAFVDPETGKSFKTTRDSVTIYEDKYIFLFQDSIQIRNLQGAELLPPTKISEAISTKNLLSYLVEDADYYGFPYALGNRVYCVDSNTFLVRLSNQLLVENAKYDAQLLKNFAKGKFSDCSRRALYVSNKIYSEELKGSCFKHPKYSESSDQIFSYRNYQIKNDSLIPLEQLSDFFVSGSDFEPRLNKLIEEQIQIQQIFGLACGNMEAAVKEFKQNFYWESANRISFVYYEHTEWSKKISLEISSLKDVLKPEFFE